MARANKEVISLCRNGATLSRAAPFLRSGAEPILLRICTKFFLNRPDLFRCRKTDYSGRGEVDVHLDADVPAGTVAVVYLDALNDRIHNGRRQLPQFGELPQPIQRRAG